MEKEPRFFRRPMDERKRGSDLLSACAFAQALNISGKPRRGFQSFPPTCAVGMPFP
jgi:hypothetical protein